MLKPRLFEIAAFLLSLGFVSFAQPNGGEKGSNAPYNEGPVWTLTMIKTKTGLADEYLKQITGSVKPV